METASLEHRAAYVADIAAELANLIADCPRIAVALRFAALDAALTALRTGENAQERA